MKTLPTRLLFASVLMALTIFNSQLDTAHAQGTAFTYQGQLNNGTNPANGSFDVRFAVYNALTAGTQQGVLITNTATTVTNGLFTVQLDFGAGIFDGNPRWLDIGVRTNGNAAFATLIPRQPVMPVPYAIYSVNASNAVTAITASNIVAGQINGVSIATNAITSNKIAAGQVVKALNGLSDSVTLSAGSNVTLNTNANAIIISSTAVAGSNGCGCCVFSERPRFVFYNEGAGGNVLANVTNSLGYLGRLDWLATVYVPNGGSYPSYTVSIAIDDDTPQTLYLQNTADTTANAYKIYNTSSVQIGNYYEWQGTLSGPISFTNKLVISCNYPTALCQAPISGSDLNPNFRCGFVRAIYVIRK